MLAVLPQHKACSCVPPLTLGVQISLWGWEGQQNHSHWSLSPLQTLHAMDTMLEVMVLSSPASKTSEMLQDILEVWPVHRVGVRGLFLTLEEKELRIVSSLFLALVLARTRTLPRAKGSLEGQCKCVSGEGPGHCY